MLSYLESLLQIVVAMGFGYTLGLGDLLERKGYRWFPSAGPVLGDQFKLWDNFIDDSTYHNYIEKSDYILPLIHQSTKSSELYKYQISGAFNLAIGYKKPLLMETRYDNYVEFRKNSIFYDKQDIVDTLNNLGKYKKNEFYNDEIWNFKFQCQQYWNLLML